MAPTTNSDDTLTDGYGAWQGQDVTTLMRPHVAFPCRLIPYSCVPPRCVLVPIRVASLPHLLYAPPCHAPPWHRCHVIGPLSPHASCRPPCGCACHLAVPLTPAYSRWYVFSFFSFLFSADFLFCSPITARPHCAPSPSTTTTPHSTTTVNAAPHAVLRLRPQHHMA